MKEKQINCFQHLKKLYPARGTKQVTLKKGTGGYYTTFISEIVGNAQVRDYDEKYILLDADNRTDERIKEAEAMAKRKDIKLIWQKPCLEGVLLRILMGNKFMKETSQQCKSLFEKKYTGGRILSEEILKNLFDKNTLEEKRKEMTELDKLIQLVEKRIYKFPE